jgi:DNA-binding response OmpR family regulator
VLVVHGVGDILDLLTRQFEGAGFAVQVAVSSFRAQAQLEAGSVDVVVAPWDAAHSVGGEIYRWVLSHRPELRSRFVFIAEDVPPEFDAVVGGRCLAVPLIAMDELVRVAQATVRRVRTPPRGIPIVAQGKPSLLLVDDDPMLLSVMTELMTESGYLVVPADGGRAAQRALEARDFDAIVTDWHMHDGSGAELYRWLLDSKPHLAPRLVFLSEADADDSGPVAPGRPMFRKGQDSQALVEMLRGIVAQVRG